MALGVVARRKGPEAVRAPERGLPQVTRRVSRGRKLVSSSHLKRRLMGNCNAEHISDSLNMAGIHPRTKESLSTFALSRVSLEQVCELSLPFFTQQFFSSEPCPFPRQRRACWRSSDGCKCTCTRAPRTSWRASASRCSSRSTWRSSTRSSRTCWMPTRTKVSRSDSRSDSRPVDACYNLWCRRWNS